MRFRPLLALALVTAAAPAAAQRAPAPMSVNLPTEIVSLACAPSLTYETPLVPLRVSGSQERTVHRTLAPGDLITINAGTDNGIDVGQEYYTRRAIAREREPISRDNPAIVHTSGWIRIYAVDRQMSLATIVHGCDAVELNDYLEPFVLPVVPPPLPGPPMAQRDNYGKVLTGVDNRTRFANGDYFVVDRGSDHGVMLGAQFIVYSDKQQRGPFEQGNIMRDRGDFLLERDDVPFEPRNFLFELGEAVAVDVRPESSTLRVTVSRDAFAVGDYVALRK